MKLPRCSCGRKAISVAPGCEPVYAPGHVLIDRGARAQAWCRACAEARGWLVAPERASVAAACATPRSARKTTMSDRSAIQRAQWADPIIRANRLSAMRAEDVRARQTARMKARWADPNERERMTTMIRRACQTARHRVVWTAEMIQELRDLRGRGISLANTAERIGVSQKILRRQMGLLGMPTSQ